ncbi:hypothetical protein M0657_008083 [Pyricularia oryzae]|nr:hypothetical protein M9X92_008760 [Pyricularia oryzae]KAI7917493.1 hypothetical protein M0657_008083 [Pyricularia oryzae]
MEDGSMPIWRTGTNQPLLSARTCGSFVYPVVPFCMIEIDAAVSNPSRCVSHVNLGIGTHVTVGFLVLPTSSRES